MAAAVRREFPAVASWRRFLILLRVSLFLDIESAPSNSLTGDVAGSDD
jgi:hypothetical protein